VRVDFHDATAADYASYATLQPELGTGDPIPDLAHWLEDFAPTTFFADAAGAIVGYANYRLLSGVGYVSNVVVDPAERGKGHGRALMDELARRFRASGATEWCLNVKPDNVAALALYRAVGLRRAYDSAVLRLTWDQIERLPVQPQIGAREIQPAEDARVSEAFRLLDGKLAELRLHAERRTIGLFEGEEPRGVAGLNLAFAPGILGSFPFRVARVELARNLFDAVRAHGGPEHVQAQAVVEDDAPLVDYLLAAGAEVHLRIEHHRGAVPSGS
jgi:GNAT superfamily N-acetyltransferase